MAVTAHFRAISDCPLGLQSCAAADRWLVAAHWGSCKRTGCQDPGSRTAGTLRVTRGRQAVTGQDTTASVSRGRQRKGQGKNTRLRLRTERRKMKWNESGFRPPLCTYRLNWARRTSWGWWDDWDDTVLQTQDSKFEPWRSEAEHATSRSRRLPTILTFTRGWGRNNFVSFKPPRPGTEPRTLAWKAAVLTTTLGPPPTERKRGEFVS